MAEKREKPTRRHLLEARKKGLVPRSPLFTATAALFAASAALFLSAEHILARLDSLSEALFRRAGQASTPDEALSALTQGGEVLLWALLPILSLVVVAVAFAGFWQTGPSWVPGRLVPDFSRLSARGNQRAPLDRRVADTGLRGLLGLALFGVGAAAIATLLQSASRGGWRTLGSAMSAIRDLGVDLLWQSAVVLAVFALADLFVQRHRWRQDVQMTRAQKARASRESHGDPTTRRRRRQRHREISRRAPPNP